MPTLPRRKRAVGKEVWIPPAPSSVRSAPVRELWIPPSASLPLPPEQPTGATRPADAVSSDSEPRGGVSDRAVWIPELPTFEPCIVCGGTDHPAWECAGWDKLNRDARLASCATCRESGEAHLHGILLVRAGEVLF